MALRLERRWLRPTSCMISGVFSPVIFTLLGTFEVFVRYNCSCICIAWSWRQTKGFSHILDGVSGGHLQLTFGRISK
jgi:hypothetical protein